MPTKFEVSTFTSVINETLHKIYIDSTSYYRNVSFTTPPLSKTSMDWLFSKLNSITKCAVIYMFEFAVK